jgi:N-acetyl-D-muramate 6-phosphate phosphatase
MPEAIIKAVLFDLDGTLADTAPDLVGALNRLRHEENLAPLPLEQLRRFASQGARGLLREGMGIPQDHPEYAVWAERFLQHYARSLCVSTALFDGMQALLDDLEQRGLVWGIVTNKHSRFTTPLLQAMKLGQSGLGEIGCVVCGDTTANPKPAPDPILHACTTLGIPPGQSIYVGDDVRDIQAGRSAGCITLAAAWGYLGCDAPIAEWAADGIIHQPCEILDWLD